MSTTCQRRASEGQNGQNTIDGLRRRAYASGELPIYVKCRMLTPDHKFELFRTVVAAVPATIVSAWALIHQRRQITPRLEVVLSPVFWPTLNGKGILKKDNWPGIMVRNQSAFPLRICNVGFRIGKKYFEFGKPLDGNFKESAWPYEIAPRARAAFYRNESADFGQSFVKALSPELKGKPIWEVGHGYAMTECARTFVSPRLSRKSLRLLRTAVVDTPA
jgi:hypothetical protein